MRSKTLILFAIAISCGLIASIGVSQYMDRSSARGAAAAEMASVFVAISDVSIGQKLTEANVRLEEWPKDRVPGGAIASFDDLKERFPRTRLYAGEPILRAKLMDSNDGSKAVDIPKGFRVVSVKVSMESSVSGLVQPGDRVDLLVFLRKNGEVTLTGTKTILRDVNVFAVDSETERNVDANGNAMNLRTVSLLVKPEQAETITLASGLGNLYLTLRRPDDDKDAISDGMTVESLIGSAAPSARSATDAAPGNGKSGLGAAGFVKWLAKAAEASKATAAAEASLPKGPPNEPSTIWTMRMLTPQGCREFRWRDVHDLPEEVQSDAYDATAATEPKEASPPPAKPSGGQADGENAAADDSPETI